MIKRDINSSVYFTFFYNRDLVRYEKLAIHRMYSTSSPSSCLFIKETIQQKQCIDNSGEEKSGNEALTTAAANRHAVINKTNAESNNTELYIKSDNTRQDHREYRRRKLEKSTQCILRLNVFMVLKLTSAGKLFHVTIITITLKKLLRIPVRF